jgi:hypothetical protein
MGIAPALQEKTMKSIPAVWLTAMLFAQTFLAQEAVPAGPGGAAAAAGGPLIQYRFEAVEGTSVPNAAGPGFAGQLQGNASITKLSDAGGVPALSLDGKTGWIQVEGSQGLHLGDKGFAIVATVRFSDSGTADGTPETHDMIVMKPNEYLFGRNGRVLYFNIHDGSNWAARVVGGECQPNVWTHVAVLVERIYEPPQGRIGYFIRLYLNGQPVAGQEVLNCTGGTNDNPLNIGKGWGGPWFLRGEIAQVSLYNRSLADAELKGLLKGEKLAKVVVSRRVAEPDPRFLPLQEEAKMAIATLREPRRRALERLLSAAVQARSHVDTEAALLPYLATVCRLAASGNDPVQEFAAAHPEFVLLDNGRVAVAVYAPSGGPAALCSLLDLEDGREILGDQRALWTLRYEPSGEGTGGPLREIDSTALSLTSTVTVDPSRPGARLEWTHVGSEEHPFQFTVRSDLALAGPRLSLDFAMENRSPEVAVREARFPVVRLRRLESGTDRLLVPQMSGVLHDNPVRTCFCYDGPYPSGSAHMQFFAYYDDRGGAYVACEDGKARSKDLRAAAGDNDCELSCLWHVGGTGGNHFAVSGRAAIELFRGDWFDAAQIYKRFARTADWWPASRLRADTPDWYRTMTVWFIGNANTTKAADDLLAMRESLELPIGLHWYNWNRQPFDDDYPHFTPREGFADTVARLQSAGVYVKPYINARIWDIRDRGDEDFEYTSVALPATVKDRQGKPVMECYNKRSFSPMCPTTTVWQKTMADLCSQVAGYGVAGIYLDQVSAGRPRICFDPTHPHTAGSGEAWLEQGYWPMLAAIRRDLKSKYPELILDGEDAAEPYMHLLDGYLPWRFLDIGHVPAYQSIYAGRIQMTGRDFNDTIYDALFPKAAEQMLYGEQIGWFGTRHLDTPAHLAFRVFVKKLAHTRRAFLPFFNEGDMLKPAAFAEPAPTVTADWGYYGPRIITTPALLHSAWRVGGQVAVLFANTSCEPVTARIQTPASAWGLAGAGGRWVEFQEGTAATDADGAISPSIPITVPGYSLAAWLIDATAGPEHRAVPTDTVTALFQALGRFDDEAGITPERRRALRAQANPWVVPDTPVRKATDWIAAAEAPKLLGARVSPDGTFVGWINSNCSICFGRVDFGNAAEGRPVIECEVALPPASAGARIRFLEAVEGRGQLLAEGKLESTGGYGTFATQRIPLPATAVGVKAIVVQFAGPGGVCNLRRWRLVREPQGEKNDP